MVVNIYAPNGAKKTFFEDLQEHISTSSYEHIVIVGDFNGTVDCEDDRSTSKKKKKKINNGRLPDSFFKLSENEDLVDVWRKRNQGNKD